MPLQLRLFGDVKYIHGCPQQAIRAGMHVPNKRPGPASAIADFAENRIVLAKTAVLLLNHAAICARCNERDGAAKALE